MNEQDKQAFAEAAKDWAAKSAGKDLGEYFWQAALEYARGKQEPVALLCPNGSFGEQGEQEYLVLARDTHPAIAGLACAFPVYTTPPAAEVNAQLLEALKEMVKMMDSGDEHGAGSDWHKKAQAAIAAAEAQQGKGE